jgi:hypothetical protein
MPFQKNRIVSKPKTNLKQFALKPHYKPAKIFIHASSKLKKTLKNTEVLHSINLIKARRKTQFQI